MSEYLMACPFCGGKAQIIATWKVRVECMKCLACVTGYDNGGAASRAWNTRHNILQKIFL